MTRSIKSTAHGLKRRWRSYAAPAPMNEFSDYDAYWRERGDLNEELDRWRLAAEMIPDGASVLDVGCGSGEFLTYLLSKKPNVVATGADFSDEAVRKTQERGYNAFRLNLEQETVTGQYDYITCFETLEHIPDAEQALQHLREAVGKQLIVSVPNVGYLDSRIRLGLFGRFPNTNCILHVKEHVRHWTAKDFHDYAAHCGMRVVRMEGQYGGRWLPWRKYPALLSPGLFYVLEQTRLPSTAPAT